MTSKRETALTGLFLYLQENIDGVTILRNEVLPARIPSEGLLILRDGKQDDPEITLSPTTYHYQHRAELEVIVQAPGSALDDLLVTVAQALDGETTLSGAVDYLRIETPEFLSEPVEGAPTIRGAVIPIILEYSTSNPLQ